MAKSGPARVLTEEQFIYLLSEIKKHRHPEKNTALVQVSFKLGLRAQEIALLQIKEVAKVLGVSSAKRYQLLEIMALPASYTKGANAANNKRSNATYNRRVVRFKTEEFDRVVAQIVSLVKAGAEIDPKQFYPLVEKRSGTSRNLPMADPNLREALIQHLDLRFSKDPNIKPTDPLFVTQKGGPYSPNTLQDHMGLMLKQWAGVEKASSHSGRRSLATDIIHGQGQSLKVAQKILGHKDASTTVIYDEPPELAITEALRGVGEAFDG